MLPNLIVVGAMKCGTTSLHHYLSLHPDISMSGRKELNFFERNWDRGLAWYEDQFPEPTKIRGECSPNYTKYPRLGAEAPERMFSVVPEARLIYLVRDPIDRLVSHYIDAYSFGRVSRPLAEELDGPAGTHFVDTSRYFMQLSRYLGFFDSSQILVVTSEDLKARTREALREVFGFLAVDDSFWSHEYECALNTAAEKRRAPRLGYAVKIMARRTRRSTVGRFIARPLARPIRRLIATASRPIERPMVDDRIRDALVFQLKDDVEELRRFTGKPLAGWSL